MRILVLLSFYDERPEWLSACVASCAKFADHVVAVDGAYGLYPDGAPASPAGQAEAIWHTAGALGMGVTLLAPQTVWAGNEVHKRSTMFALAETIAASDDWYFVMDADQVVSDVRCDLKARLEATDLDAGEVMFWCHREQHDPQERPFVSPMLERQGAVRVLFRAIPGLRVQGRHYQYVTPDGRILWGDYPTERAEDLQDDIHIEHRCHLRDLGRAKAARDYYRRRDELKIEVPA